MKYELMNKLTIWNLFNAPLGTAVFSGMIGVTLFGIFLTPVFFSVIMKFFARQPAAKVSPPPRPEGQLEKSGV